MSTTEVEARQYSERELSMGLPAVEALAGLTLDERRQQSAEVAAYLLFHPDEVQAATASLEQLYSRTSVRGATCTVRDVDVFAGALTYVLKQNPGKESSDRISLVKLTRRIVADQQHLKTEPTELDFLDLL